MNINQPLEPGRINEAALLYISSHVEDLSHIAKKTEVEKCYIGRNIKAGDGVQIKNSAVYDNAALENNVKITNSLLMSNVTVRSNTKIKNSVIMRNCVIGEDSEIVDSIIAPDMDLRGKSRIYNVSLASKVIEDEK